MAMGSWENAGKMRTIWKLNGKMLRKYGDALGISMNFMGFGGDFLCGLNLREHLRETRGYHMDLCNGTSAGNHAFFPETEGVPFISWDAFVLLTCIIKA
jgi:hypothetical protein